VSTLARLSAGNMRFGGRFSTLFCGGFARFFESFHVRSVFEPVTRPRIRIHSCQARDPVTTAYELRCRECGRTYGLQPLSICDECFSPLEVAYDLEYARTRFTREKISQGPLNMWRYRALLPVSDSYVPQTPAGFTPLVEAPRLASHIGARNLYIKNDAVCMPTLSFKDRVVAVALANAQAFGFDTVGCSSTGNLANAVAAQAARLGLKTYILVPSDLEPAKILNTQVYGATLVRVEGNYDHVNRLSSQIADRYNWGFVNVNLRPYYAEGSKTVGYEIAEQLGWRLPDNVVVPMAGGSLITKIRKAFNELVALGLVDDKPVRFFGAQATGCSPIAKAVKNNSDIIEPQRPHTIARSLAIGNPADGLYAARAIRATGGWAEDVSDVEIVSAIQELAETEGIFTETAGGVTTAVTARLYAHGRIKPDELTVTCITGNGLKTTDVLHGAYDQSNAIRPRLADFENFVEEHNALSQEFSLAGR
jgi:threonine synthase